MKKIAPFFSLILLGTTTYYAQIGIHTENPQGSFHIDGAKDNPNTGTPTIAQQRNDLVVNNLGMVGIGTTTPTTNLEVNSEQSPAFKLVDGTQGAGKILTSDASGSATWTIPNSFKPIALAVYPALNTTIPGTSSGAYKYSQTYIDLTQGKWVVSAGLTISATVSAWIHVFLSSSTDTTALSQTGFIHLGPSGNSTSYAGQILNGFNFISGSSVINVTAPTQRIYLMIQNFTNWSYSTGNFENYLYAIPVN